MYFIKETYYTIQGEGFHSGRPAVFVRFSGCNLWSGHEKDRKNAKCKFCDTDFVGINGKGGAKFKSAKKLAHHAFKFWPKNAKAKPFIVCTGGEPLLQIDESLITELHELDFEIAIETNGTINSSLSIDWICVSPKTKGKLLLRKGNELKLVYPQDGASPSKYDHLDFDHFYLQPMDGKNIEKNIEKTIKYCHKYPHWKISLQTHKFLNIP